MENVQVDLEKMKKLQVDMLKEFIKVCTKLNLRYYLLAGTLLGAVRHKGFIPWDDDIDVGMPRRDYEVFLQKGQELLPKHLFIQTIYTDPNYLMCFGKIRNSQTTFIESSVSKKKINHGVYIDIFPLDYYPEDAKASAKIDKKKKYYNLRIGSCFHFMEKRSLKYKLGVLLSKIRYPSLKRVLRKRDVMYKTIPQSDMLANYGGAWGQKEIVPECWYGEGTELSFEGLTVIGPKEYDKWLTQVYGNYMELPPVEKRVTHHYTDVIDLDNPYTMYCK